MILKLYRLSCQKAQIQSKHAENKCQFERKEIMSVLWSVDDFEKTKKAEERPKKAIRSSNKEGSVQSPIRNYLKTS